MILSIITVNFNNLEGLKRTFESVASQTFRDYEWLVIDGGSTDGSKEFIEQHQAHFAYWCSEPDKGIYHAMNKGILKSAGAYLNFMNSGDQFAAEDTLAIVFAEPRTADIVYGYMMRGQSNSYLAPQAMKEKLHWSDLYPDTLPHQASFIRRELFAKVGLYNEQIRVVSDTLWFETAILRHKASVQFVPQKIAIFDDGGVSTLQQHGAETQMLKNTFFPDFISEEDIFDYKRLSLVQAYGISRLLFRLAVVVAIKVKTIKRHFLLKRL